MLGGFFRKMRLIVILAVISALLSAVFGLAGDMAWLKRLSGEKFYEETELKVEAQVLPDGSMNVKETRTLDFSGDFSRYRRQIPHIRFGSMVDVKVSELNTPYTRIQTPAGRPEHNFVFSKSTVSGIEQYVVELFFHAKDTQKTFIIEYRITDVIEKHNDVAELDWKFIGANRSVNIGKMSVLLKLPDGAQADEVKVWGHGPLKGDVKKLSGSQVAWQANDLPKERFFEGRVVFPLRLVPQGRNFTKKEALSGILVQEQRWAEERAKEQRKAMMIVALSIVLALLGPGMSWWIYRQFGQKYKPSMEVEYYRELPGSYSPAETGCLLAKGQVLPNTIAATFLDLARRGYVRFEQAHNTEGEDILVRQLKSAGEELANHERLLLDFFFNRVGAMQPAVWFSALKLYRKSDAQGTSEFVKAFQAAVKGKMDETGYLEPGNRAKKYSYWGMTAALFGAFGCYSFDWFYPMIALLLSLISFLLVMTCSRDYTKQGQQQVDLWEAFRRFLKDFSNLDKAQLPQLILWEHYLVYAVVLGVATEVIKQLPIVYPQISEPDSQFGYYWGGMHHTHYGEDGMLQQTTFAGFSSFSDIISSLGDTWNSTYSAVAASSAGNAVGSGEGGGFSGGGGDGGGGGGGDAD